SDPPGRRIGDSDIKHLSLTNEIVQGAHYFLDRSDLVPDMNPIQVDVISLKPLQTSFDCLHHVLAVITRCVWVRARSGVCKFSCEHHALAMSFKKLSEKGLTCAIRVDVGGIDEVAS